MKKKTILKRIFSTALCLMLVVCTMLSMAVPAAAADGNFTGYFKLSYNGFKEVIRLNVPCGGNTVTAGYVWNPAKYCFELQITEGSDYADIWACKTINDVDVSGVSWTYTSPKTGNGDGIGGSQYTTAITTAKKTVKVNLVVDSKVVGSVSTVLSETVFGKYLIKAADLETTITEALTNLGYDADKFDFTQQAYTEFIYSGCSPVNFSFDGSKPVTPDPDPEQPETPDQPEVPDPEQPEEDETCKLKIYGVEYGVTENSPTYGNPRIEWAKPGNSYLILTPSSYGIYPKEGYEFDHWEANSTDPRESNTHVYIPAGFSGLSIVAYFKQIEMEASEFIVELVTEDGTVVGTYKRYFSGQYYAPITIEMDEEYLPTNYVFVEGQTAYTGIVGRPATVQFKVKPTYQIAVTKSADSITKEPTTITAENIGVDGAVTLAEKYTLTTDLPVVLKAAEGQNICKVYLKDRTTGKVVVNKTGAWDSVNLTETFGFKPEKGHYYTVDLLTEADSCIVYFSKNTAYVQGSDSLDRNLDDYINYKVYLNKGFGLMPLPKYRITKVVVKDVKTNKNIYEKIVTDPNYSFDSSVLELKDGGKYVVHFNVEKLKCKIQFTKNTQFFTADRIADLQNEVNYDYVLADGLALTVNEDGEQFTKVYIKDTTINKVVVNKTDSFGPTIELKRIYEFEANHTYAISILVG